MGECGYGVAYRVLDAQYFGVAQRRRRVFVVGHLGDWRRSAAVLFERHSLQGHPAPSREKGQATASAASRGLDVSCTGTLTAGFGKVGAPEIDAYTATPWPANVAATLNAQFGEKQGLEDQHINQGAPWFVPVTHSLRGEGFDASEDGTGRGAPLVPVVTDTLTSNGDAHSGFRDEKGLVPVSYGIQANIIGRQVHNGGNGLGFSEECAPTLTKADQHGVAVMQATAVAFVDVGATLKGGSGARGYPDPSDGNGHNIVGQSMQVRRLTPKECCRLQGFPDDYLDVMFRGKPAADGPRYKALGNSMAVPCMHWIGSRIQMVEDVLAEVSEKDAA